jgi:DNA-binding GntR family transcriptional regulator
MSARAADTERNRLGAGGRPALTDYPSRTEAVATEIEAAIFGGIYGPGDRLVERELAERLGVSKTPVREALKALAGRGLVVAHPYRGMRILDIDAQMVSNLYGVRVLLEPAAVHESVLRSEPGDLAAAREALEAADRAAKAQDLAGLVTANRRFHQILTSRCSNTLLTGILDELRDQVALVIVWNWRAESTWQREAADHARMLRAAERGDAERAARELRLHIERTMNEALGRF